MIIGGEDFDITNNTYIMGILNVTPDSFSDGGSAVTLDDALKKTEKMITEGADIIDIGGESTRPGAEILSVEAELERVMPAIEAIKKEFDVPVSLDTYKSQVAKEALRSGVDLINDIWGLKYDPNMAQIIATSGAACCLMHNRECVNKTVHNDVTSSVMEERGMDCVDAVMNDLRGIVNIAKNAGINDNKIILDPGIGFAKDTEQNLILLKELKKFNDLGYPVLLGCSRKSVIGNTLNRPVDDRVAGTVATSVYAAMCNTAFVRVHDVKENADAIRMIKAMLMA